MTKTAPLRPSSASGVRSVGPLAALLCEWLPRQRWFAGKDRPLTDLRMLSMTELYPGCLHLLVHADQSGMPTPGALPRPATATSCCSASRNTCRRGWDGH